MEKSVLSILLRFMKICIVKKTIIVKRLYENIYDKRDFCKRLYISRGQNLFLTFLDRPVINNNLYELSLI